MLGHAHIVSAGRKGGPSPSRYRSAVTGRDVARRASTARQIDGLPERLERRRAFRLELQREQIRRVDLQQRRDAIIWKTLEDDHLPSGVGHDQARRPNC
jgi:hypothetical protein